MGELRFPGLATGIDTAAIIRQMMIINSRRLAAYQVKKTEYEEQSTALDELRTKITALQSAASALADADDMEVFSASSSDKDMLTIAASSEAAPGSHSIEINQLATTETWIQDSSTFDYETDYVGAGTFIYSYNNQETTITAIANETTLEDFVNLINKDENNPGVTASLLQQGGKYHLMLSGQQTGEDYQISINASSTEVWKGDITFTLASDATQNAGLTTKITELSQFTENGGLKGDEKIIISGKNHFGVDLPNTELSVTANTTIGHLIDAINEQFDGVATARFESGEIYITDHISGTSLLEVGLTYDNGATGDTALTVPTPAVSTEGNGTLETLTSLDSSTFIKTQSAQSSEIKVDGYPSTAIAEEQRLTLGSVTDGGTFTLTYGGQTTAPIAHDATTTAIQTALEGLSNVTAGDIVVTEDRLDENSTGYTKFMFLSTAGDVKMISIDTSSLSFSGASTAIFAETTKGNDGYIHRNSNSVTDALSGITLNLHDLTEANDPIQITVRRNTGMIGAKIQTMVNAYNELMAELKTKTEYDAEAKKMGILSRDIAVSFIKTQTRNSFIGIAEGFVNTIDDFVQASDIGITIDGAGMMEFDADEFNDAINDNFGDVLELLGATQSGNSTSSVVDFHSASERYTTAGTYEVQVDINAADSSVIDEVRIRLYGESTWRTDVSWNTNTGIIIFDNNLDSDNDPLYPEDSLQLSIDLTKTAVDTTYNATINVKQGIAGILEDLLDEALKTGGRLDVSKEMLNNLEYGKIRQMEKRIESEENRLNKVETRLINKFARLERTLAMMQKQMAVVSMVSSATFG